MLDDVALSGVDVKRDPKAPEVRKAEIPDAGADLLTTKVMDRARRRGCHQQRSHH